MRSIKSLSICLLIAANTFLSSGCKKVDEPEVNNNKNVADPVNVLNENSGFSQFYDDVMILSSAPSMGVLDYTLESNGNFNFAYYSSTTLQQGNLRINKRITKNINTNQIVPLPTEASTLDYSKGAIEQDGRKLTIEMYRPYSNFFTYATEYQGSSNFKNSCAFAGDITFEVASIEPLGKADLGYRFPCMNIYARANDNGYGYFSTGIKNPTYMFKATNPRPFVYSNNSDKIVHVSFLESDIFTYKSFKAFMVREDSMLVYNVSTDSSKTTWLTGVSVSGIPTNFNQTTTLRHYRPDGKVVGFLVQDLITQHFWTFSYDFNTGIMTKGLNDVKLEYSGEGTDFDIDEFGNIYYTGYASNGSNTNGVSIYKKETNGTVSLIGKDDFLKFGQVIKLKVLMGKIYLAVTGKKTNSSYYQISILKEN